MVASFYTHLTCRARSRSHRAFAATLPFISPFSAQSVFQMPALDRSLLRMSALICRIFSYSTGSVPSSVLWRLTDSNVLSFSSSQHYILFSSIFSLLRYPLQRSLPIPDPRTASFRFSCTLPEFSTFLSLSLFLTVAFPQILAGNDLFLSLDQPPPPPPLFCKHRPPALGPNPHRPRVVVYLLWSARLFCQFSILFEIAQLQFKSVESPTSIFLFTSHFSGTPLLERNGGFDTSQSRYSSHSSFFWTVIFHQPSKPPVYSGGRVLGSQDVTSSRDHFYYLCPAASSVDHLRSQLCIQSELLGRSLSYHFCSRVLCSPSPRIFPPKIHHAPLFFW